MAGIKLASGGAVMAAQAPAGAPPARAVEFRELVERVQYAASGDKTRSAICGVWLEQETPESLLAVATDGYRLALARGRFSFPLPVDRPGQGALLRADALAKLAKLAPKRRQWWNLSATIAGDDLVIRTDGGELRASRVAEFPNWRQVRPTVKAGAGFKLEPVAANIVREFGAMAPSRCITVTARPPHLVLGFAVETTSYHVKGEAVLRMLEWPFDGELPPTVGVNANYLADALEHVSGAVELHLGRDEIGDPLVLVGPRGEAVVMPVRV